MIDTEKMVRYMDAKIAARCCWAYVRRKLYDLYVALDSPIAREGIHRIDELYRIETEIRGLSPEDRRQERQARAVPLLDALYTWLMSKLARMSQKSALAKAIRYAVEPAHWPSLMYYRSDGHVEIDNNAAERSPGTVALGRKSYLFAGSDVGGERAAAMYSPSLARASSTSSIRRVIFATSSSASQIILSAASTSSCLGTLYWHRLCR